jgi:thiol-disulfide isomerase/thioredoxin
MLLLLWWCVLLVLPFTTIHAAILTLTDQNYRQMTNGGKVFVAFVKHDCPHCKRLMPDLERVAADPANLGRRGIKIARVDATQQNLVADFDVRGYPTLYYLDQDMHRHEYLGVREAKAMTQYLVRMTSPALVVLKTPNQVNEFAFRSSELRDVDLDPVTFLLVGGDDEPQCKSAIETMANDAEFRAKAFFAVVSLRAGDFDPALSNDAVLVKLTKGEPALVLTTSKDDVVNLVRLRRLLQFHQFPLVSALGAHNFHEITHDSTHKRRVFIQVADNFKNHKYMSNLKAELLPMAQEWQHEFLFGVLDGDKYMSFLVQFLSADFLQAFVYDSFQGLYYIDANSTRTVNEFLESVKQGNADFRREGVWGWPYKAYERVMAFHLFVRVCLILIVILGVWQCIAACFFTPRGGRRAREAEEKED